MNKKEEMKKKLLLQNMNSEEKEMIVVAYKKMCSDILTHVYNSLFPWEDIVEGQDVVFDPAPLTPALRDTFDEQLTRSSNMRLA